MIPNHSRKSFATDFLVADLGLSWWGLVVEVQISGNLDKELQWRGHFLCFSLDSFKQPKQGRESYWTGVWMND